MICNFIHFFIVFFKYGLRIKMVFNDFFIFIPHLGDFTSIWNDDPLRIKMLSGPFVIIKTNPIVKQFAPQQTANINILFQ